MLNDVLDEVADMLVEHIYEDIDNYTLDFISEIIDASY